MTPTVWIVVALTRGSLGEHLVQAALGLRSPGRRCRAVGEGAAADDVVGDDQAAGAGAVERPGEVVGRVDLVGVDEDEVERTGALLLEGRQRLQGRADPELDQLAEPGPLDVRARDLGVGRRRPRA